MTTTLSTKQHITSTPGVCGGQPCIAGTRIRVQDIYAWHELQRQSPDEIVSQFPQLSLADVYAALTFFWDNREEMLALMEKEAKFIEEVNRKHPSRLQEKLAAKKNHGPAISS